MAYQSVGIRFVAQFIDAVPIGVFYLVVGRLVAGVAGGVTESGFELRGGAAVLVIGLTAAFWILYMAVLEAQWNGQSLGKKLAAILVWTSPRRQRLGDRVARTVVTRTVA